MESKRQNVIRVADNVSFAPRGLDYELEPGTIYTAQYDDYTGIPSLKIAADFSMPEKLFETESSKKFKDRVLRAFENSSRTTGVMLSGVKGTGKTIMAKRLALESNLPIILIGSNFPTFAMPKLADKLAERSVCIVLDELDKFRRVDDESGLLQLFDGISTAGNNLIIATCNDIDEISDCLWDRCSRFRYHREYREMDRETIYDAVKSFNWVNISMSDYDMNNLTDFIIRTFKVKSFDNVNTFCDEINNNPTEVWDELVRDMNITEIA